MWLPSSKAEAQKLRFIEHVCSALAGGLLTSEPPGKQAFSVCLFFFLFCLFVLMTNIKKLAQTAHHVSLRPWHGSIYHQLLDFIPG